MSDSKHKRNKKSDSESNQSGNSQAEVADLFDKPVKQKNQDGEIFWSLGNKKRVTVSQFKGKTYVNIRQYYQQDGQLKPSKKGISLATDQWNEFKKVIEDIDKQLTTSVGVKGTKKVKK